VLVKNKALLSLKDYNLRNRIEELADAGITSFKIEGRLKNESYVRNVVRDYSLAIEEIISRRSGEFVRGSFGKVTGGFDPDTRKTFNRGYTELFIDGKRGKWACLDAAKSMGEEIGSVASAGRDGITVRMANRSIVLNNGDGFSFVAKDGSVCGFRGDVCEGNRIRCRQVPEIYQGARLFRNLNAAFEKEIERNRCIRLIEVETTLKFTMTEGNWAMVAENRTEDGRIVTVEVPAGDQEAVNQSRMEEVFKGQFNKTTGLYIFRVTGLETENGLPFMAAGAINAVRRDIAARLDESECIKRDLLLRKIEKVPAVRTTQKEISYKSNVSNRISEDVYRSSGVQNIAEAYELSHQAGAELMRTKYCIRYELGMCPVHQNAKNSGPLFLLNNGQKFALHFDCRNCEMTLTEA
jgi:putative protease